MPSPSRSTTREAPPKTPTFPAVRAAIFDMDGLLINTEDLYFKCMCAILTKYNRPPLPSSLKPKLMGVPSPVAASISYAWANLPITRAEFDLEQAAQQQIHYPHCEILPGVAELLRKVKLAGLEIALASSSSREMYKLKTSRPDVKKVFEVFRESHIVLGDHPAIKKDRGKPAPDIFLLALECINSSREAGDRITPAECMVFEDSVPGIEAGRRAGMRVCWVPHPDLVKEFDGREEEVLAGRNGMSELGDEGLGAVGDGWGFICGSLEDFQYDRLDGGSR